MGVCVWITYLFVHLPASTLLLVLDGLLFLLGLAAVEGTDFNTGRNHLLELPFVARLLLLLGLGEKLALLFELFDLLLLLLLPLGLLLFFALRVFFQQTLLFLDPGFVFGLEAFLLFLAAAQLFLLLLKSCKMGWKFFLLASGLRSRSCGRLGSLLLDGLALFCLGGRRGGRAFFLRSL